MGKKRKVELDLDVERTMYSSFVTAANAVSQLYTQGVQQQRRVAAAASRTTLERVLNFVLREGGGAEQVPKAALIQFLQHEYENADSQPESAASQPQMLLPFGVPGFAGGQEDSQESQQPKQPSRQLPGGNMIASPALRGRSGSMDDQHQQHQQQQQMQLHQQQQHLQMQQQQLQHQQQHPHISGSSMQMQTGLMHGMASGSCFTEQAHGLQHNMFMPPGAGMH